MKHIGKLSRNLPAHAMSAMETDGMFQKAGRMLGTVTSLFATATAGWNFYQLVTKPKD